MPARFLQRVVRPAVAFVCSCLANATAAEQYFPPSESNGGWRSLVPVNARPSEEQKAEIRTRTGFDWDKLSAAWAYATSFAAPTRPNSVLVVRHGWIAGEWSNMTTLRGIASASKSITALTVAKLCDLSDAGHFAKKVGIDDYAWRYLPPSWAAAEPARKQIQLRHLLTMTSGLTPFDGPYGEDYETRIFEQPVEAPPGEVWAYASHTVDMLSYIVQEVSGRSMADFFNEEIGAPLGTAKIVFPPIGGTNGLRSGGSGGPGGGIQFSARDLARLGYLLLHRGQWITDGRTQQVVSAKRVAEFTQNADWLRTAKFRRPNFASEEDAQLNYGYLFWNNSRQTRLGPAVPRDAFYMSGWGKQTCVVIPSLDMVVVRIGPRRELNTQPDFYREFFARVMAALVERK